MDKNVKRTFETRVLWAGLIILLVTLNLFLVFRIFNAREELNARMEKENVLNARIDELTAGNQSLQEENGRLQVLMERYRRKAIHQPVLSAEEIAELKGTGLKDPVNDIKTDLVKHNELIPYKGVLGGTMKFAVEDEIHILSTRWVRAHFEDGHIGGWMLLEYQIANDGQIQWRVLDSYPNTPNYTTGK